MPVPFGMTPSDVEAGLANPGSSSERSPLLGNKSEKGKGYANDTVTSYSSIGTETTATESSNEDVISLGPINKSGQKSIAFMLCLLLCVSLYFIPLLIIILLR